MRFRLIFLSLLLGLSAGRNLFAADTDYVVINGIMLSGNHKTKDFIILRELDIKVGDTIALQGFALRMENNRNRIFNTRLFNHVDLFETHAGGKVTVEVRVIEKWYVWPYPVLQFADRNFNIWWETRDPGRLNYGFNVHHYNFRGRAEILKLRVLAGYTRSLGVDYEIPYLDKKKRKGVQLVTAYNDNKEVWYRTRNNRLEFLFDPHKRAVHSMHADLSFIYRPKLYMRHIFTLGVEKLRVSDTVVRVTDNPVYLAGGKNTQTSLRFLYTFKWDKRDIAYYPLKGFFIEINAEPRYLAESKSMYFSLKWNFEKFYRLDNRLFAGIGYRGKYSAPQNQPYQLMQALGYKFFVRGFEPYVIDGQSYNLVQTNIKYRFLNGNFELPLIHMSQFKKVPYAFYFTVYGDAGYVTNYSRTGEGNSYQNSMLSGYGAGLDFVTYYDRVMRVEYSFNNFGKGGLYIHFTAPI